MPRIVLKALVCVGLLCSVVSAHAADAPKKRAINLDDLNRIVRVGGPIVSPDGAWVAYTAAKVDTKEDKNVSQLWMVSWDGSVHLQLTYAKEGASAPRFSPDGKYISFLSSRPGAAKGAQVWVMDRRGGEPQQFTAITDKEIESYIWSPDSQKLLLTMHPKFEPDEEEGKPPAPPKPIVIDRYHFKQDIEGYIRNDAWDAFYLYDIQSKKFEKLTTDKNVNEEEPLWSPDGAWIAYVSNHDADPDRSTNTDVFVVSPKPGSTARKLTASTGPDGGRLAWSPDSKAIAYTQGIEAKLDQILTMLQAERKMIMSVQDDVDAAVAAVAQNSTVLGSVQTLLTQLTQMLTNLKGQIMDPTAQAALEQAISTLQANNTALATAVTQNTPAS